MVVTNYQPMLHKISEEQRSQKPYLLDGRHQTTGHVMEDHVLNSYNHKNLTSHMQVCKLLNTSNHCNMTLIYVTSVFNSLH